MSRHRDFDAASSKPLSFTMLGRPYMLPGSPPATLVAKFMALDAQEDGPQKIKRALDDLFVMPDGRNFLDDMRSTQPGFTFEMERDLTAWAMGKWGLGPGLAADQTLDVRLANAVENVRVLLAEANSKGEELSALLAPLLSELGPEGGPAMAALFAAEAPIPKVAPTGHGPATKVRLEAVEG